MVLVTCKECGGELSTKADKCPKCGAVRKNHGCLMAIALLFGFIFLVAILNPSPELDSKKIAVVKVDTLSWKDRDRSAMAIVQAREFVKTRLKSPSTAQFPGMFEQKYVKRLSDRHYVVISWVDAQNSFGAMIRTRYRAEVWQVTEDRWLLYSLKMPY